MYHDTREKQCPTSLLIKANILADKAHAKNIV